LGLQKHHVLSYGSEESVYHDHDRDRHTRSVLLLCLVTQVLKNSTLTLMQAWTLFVVEEPQLDPAALEKANAMGLDVSGTAESVH
jgi:hypothetical protein